MRIAVTYENGNVFQHFGHSEQFKVYEVQDGKVLYSEVIDSMGSGHGALAGLLAENYINVLICGGIGGGAQAALADAGIDICSGIEGDADEAVEAFLKGELESAGVNCDHHDHEEGGCGSDCGSGCGSSCGGCGGAPQFTAEGPNVGKTCKVHYRGTFNDGTQFDSSYDRGETLDFVCGIGMMIPGFDKAVAQMEVGQVIDIHLMPEEAYGEANPALIMTFPVDQMPGAEDLSVGEMVMLSSMDGRQFPVRVVALENGMITFDANSEMAGKELNFRIELVAVE